MAYTAGDTRHALKRVSLSVVGVVCLTTISLHAEDWPQWRGVHRDGVWTDTGIVERFPDRGLQVTWRVPIHGGFAGPTVAGGRVFVLDYEETPGSRTMDGTERLLALDEETGAVLWTQTWPAAYRNISWKFANGPRTPPTVDGDRVYVLGAAGMISCLDAETGEAVWQVDTAAEYGATRMADVHRARGVHADELDLHALAVAHVGVAERISGVADRLHLRLQP